MLILGPKMPHLLRSQRYENFPQKMACVTFMCLLNPKVMQKMPPKSNETILKMQC